MIPSGKTLSLFLFVLLIGGLIPVRAQEVTAEPDMAAEQIVETLVPPTEEAAVEQAVTEAPVTEEPATTEPVTQEPVTEEPVTTEPTITSTAPVVTLEPTVAPTLAPTLEPTILPTAVPTEPAALVAMDPAAFAAAMQSQNRVRDDVVTALQNSETVRVIINYTTPVSVRGLSDQQRISTIRSQAAVLKDSLPAAEVTISHEFNIMPAMAAEVTRAGALAMASNPLIQSVQIDGTVRKSLATARVQIDVPQAEALGYDGSGINVAVLDTGIDPSHPSLADDVVAQQCFLISGCPGGGTQSNNAADGDGHGTHVSGIITSSDATHKGIANGAGIVAVKVMDDSGFGSDSDILAGLDWVYLNRNTYNIRVVNMSLGSNYNNNAYCDSDFPAYATVINQLTSAGVVVVTASGNESSSTGVSSPACIGNSLAIGAVNSADSVAVFSNVGAILDAYAPGDPVTSTVPGGGFAAWSGTSMASPATAGVVALMLQANPSLTFSEVRNILQTTGPSITARGYTFRRVDADDAIIAAGGGASPTPTPVDESGMLMALYNGTGGASWVNSTGWNTSSDYCTWYGVICTGGLVTGVELSQNNLVGSIPSGFTDLSSLATLNLSGNALSGEVPDSFINLTNLSSLNIGYNALTATNSNVVSFLNGLSPDWWASQTVTPSGLTAANATASSIDLSWSPIAYTGGGGYYEVRYSTSSSGPYDQIGCITAGKITATCTVSGLQSSTQYTFVVRAYTEVNANNGTAIWSSDSSSVSASTSGIGSDTPSLISPANGAILENILRPTFEWAAVSNAVYYHIQVSDEADFDDALALTTSTNTITWPYNLERDIYYWRVQAYANGTWTTWTPASTFSLIVPGPAPIFPADGSALQDTPRPTFTWQPMVGASYYRVQVSYNANFRHSRSITTISDSATWNRNLDSGTWYWRVKAYVNGDWTDYGTPFSFTLSASDAPVLVDPIDGANLQYTPQPTFIWQPVDGALLYLIQVSDEPDLDDARSRVSYTDSITWPYSLDSDTYYWRVKAYANGRWTGWSAPFTLTLSSGIPPALIDPVDGAILENTSQPTFLWEAVDGASRYLIEVSDEYDLDDARAVTTYTNSITWLRSLDSDTYYWRVKAYANGMWTGWSTVSTFTLSAGSPPMPIQPVNGDMLEYVSQPTFTWEAIDGAVYYRLQVSDEPDLDDARSVTSYTNSATWRRSLDGGTYYWRVKAYANGMWTDWSTPFTFTLSAGSPPLLISPANGATLENSPRPTFTWEAIDGASAYRIQVSDEADLDDERAMTTYTNSVTWGRSLDIDTYYWRVQAYVNGMWTDWSTISTFTLTPISPPVLTGPTDGEALENNPRPTFTWNPIDGVSYYRVQVADNADFRRPTTRTARDATYNWTTSLSSGTYHWRVQAYVGGMWTDYSTPSTLTLSAPGPSPASPADGTSLEFTPRPTFQWNGIDGATSYRVQVANNAEFTRPATLTARTNNITWNRPLQSGSYYWRVQAYVGGIWTDYSTPSTLTLSAPAPAMVSPMNGATLTDSPTFSWRALDEVVYYQVQVASNANFTRPLTRYVRTNQFNWPYAMQDGATYHWRVRAYVNGIWTDWSNQPFSLTLGG